MAEVGICKPIPQFSPPRSFQIRLLRPPIMRRPTYLEAVLDEPLLGEPGQLAPGQPRLHGAQHAAALRLEVLLQHFHRPVD